MDTKQVILELRTQKGMSQDELAEKVFVSRQAVSRWENGETVPNTETLKLLSKVLDVSINTLLGSPRKLICQCCGMPLEDDDIIGHNHDGSFNEDYCKWCYADGTYTYNDMDDLIEVCVKNMVSENFTEEQARSYMKELLPTLDYWKKYDELSDNGQFEEFKKKLINEINELNVDGMPKVEKLNTLVGKYVNFGMWRRHIWAISLNVNTAAIDVSALLQIWILFLFALMKKTVRIRNLYCIRKDEDREK